MTTRKSSVNTKEFKDISLFSKQLRKLLKIIIIPLSSPDNRPAYEQQFDQASRNVEITLERLGKLILLHPRKAGTIISTIHAWQRDYFSTQSDTKDLKLYDVYTEADKKIPFLPEEDIMYTYMLTQVAIIAHELAKRISHQELGHIAKGFIDLNTLATNAFRQHPTVMPRFTNHNRISLRTIQRLDAPLNCCPSLHIAYSLYLDNIAEGILLNRFNEKSIFSGLRYSTLRMFNSVLYTKQHALIDVSFGILAAKVIFQKRYQGETFNDLTHEFPALKKEHSSIQYDTIEKTYREAESTYESCGSFEETLGLTLQKQNYPRVYLNT